MTADMPQNHKACAPDTILAQLSMETPALNMFSRLMQKGMNIQFTTGCSITEFLCGQLGITPEYLDSRIQTIFLEGKAVDAPESRALQDGANLSLAAAMPGLAGATLRRGGHFVGFRQGITDDASQGVQEACPGRLTLKLFNLLIKEIGPSLLERGVILSRQELHDLLAQYQADFMNHCRRAQAAGRELDLKEFYALKWLPVGMEAELRVGFE